MYERHIHCVTKIHHPTSNDDFTSSCPILIIFWYSYYRVNMRLKSGLISHFTCFVYVPYLGGGSVAEWLACWSQAHKGPAARVQIAVATLSGNSLMGLLQLRFEHDSSTIRARFEHDTTSYEELCAFEQ